MTKEAEEIIDSLDVSDDTKERLKNEINAMIVAENLSREGLRREMLGFVPKIHCKHYDFRSDVITFCEERKYKRELLGSIPRLHCQSCNREIPYDEKYVKENLLYVTSDWTKCLCSRCTNNWKRQKEIAELHPDFGKGKDCKIWIDEI